MRELILLMKSSGLSLNQIYMLYCIHYKLKPLNINVHTELRVLKNLSLVGDKMVLSPKALEILSQIPVTALTQQKIDITDEYITKYLNLFPKGKLPSGKQARADKKNIKSNFTWFFDNYPNYSWDIVLKATALYVDEYEAKGYLYMRTSQYFISKLAPDRTRESELANYCSSIINNDYEADSNHFTEKVV